MRWAILWSNQASITVILRDWLFAFPSQLSMRIEALFLNNDADDVSVIPCIVPLECRMLDFILGFILSLGMMSLPSF